MTSPAQVSRVSEGLLRIVIHEGRNRQVRRMCAAVGHDVTRLVRTRIGPIQDATLSPGASRQLSLGRGSSTHGGRGDERRDRLYDAYMRSALLRGLRGATTCESDTPAAIEDATQELLRAMTDRNELVHDDIVSVIFTTTRDLTSTFPATVARGIGFGDIPLALRRGEIDVPGSMSDVHPDTRSTSTPTRSRDELQHVYLRNAQGLRDDLPG